MQVVETKYSITLGKSLKERQAATTNYPFSARIAHNDFRKLMTTMVMKIRNDDDAKDDSNDC